MEKVNFLPLGSIVVINGGVKKYMVIARGLNVNLGSKQVLFDYGACRYPEGMEGDQVMYFQHEDIAKVIFEGFNDEDNEMMIKNINDQLSVTKLDRANVKELKAEMEVSNG